MNFQMFKLDLEKAEEPEIKFTTFVVSQKKQEIPEKKSSTSASLTTLKPLMCESEQIVENSERDGNTRPPNLPPEKSGCWSICNS